MAVKILWYLTTLDGPYLWEPKDRWHTDFEHLKQLAVASDRLGYYGSLLGSSPSESLAVAAALVDAPQRLRFLVAQHSGELSPAVLAKWPLTVDQFSNGRLLFNVVNGSDAGLATLGVRSRASMPVKPPATTAVTSSSRPVRRAPQATRWAVGTHPGSNRASRCGAPARRALGWRTRCSCLTST